MTLDTGSDQYVAQKILTAASTRIGELPLLPRFGTEDPEFSEFDSGGLYYTCATYFPEVRITEILQADDGLGSSQITVAFDVLNQEPTPDALT